MDTWIQIGPTGPFLFYIGTEFSFHTAKNEDNTFINDPGDLV
jgi:hypothetical protein